MSSNIGRTIRSRQIAGHVVRPLLMTMLALQMACTSAPDQLSLSAAPTCESFRPGELMTMQVTLKAPNAPVCLARSFAFYVELYEEGGTLVAVGTDKHWLCGTGYMATLPLYPFILVGRLLDVADLSRRFIVVPARGEHRQEIAILLRDAGGLVVCEINRLNPGCARDRGEEVPPGTYTVKLKLLNEQTDSHPLCFYPHPLFWKPYEHAVEGEGKLVISFEEELHHGR